MNKVLSPDTVDMVATGRTFMPRLIEHNTLKEPILGVEVLDGPYKGVVFAYTRFYQPQGVDVPDGMAPVKFDTTVYYPDNFVPDSNWDDYTAAVLLTWLVKIKSEEVVALMKMPVKGIH